LTSRNLHLTQTGLPSPLLVPSISSKGFPFLTSGESETANVLRLVAPDLTESLLISAYDIQHGHVPDVDQLLSNEHLNSLYATPALLVIDSGGYELSDVFESGDVGRDPREILPFTREDYDVILGRLPKDRAILAVTYDEQTKQRSTYDEQVDTARALVVDYPHLKIDFLIKPPGRSRFIDSSRLSSVIPELRAFPVVGFTEKELGATLLDRLMTLARIRRGLDDAELPNVALHVFGGLDPLLTTLYFMCGAEIFDGLSWLRYAYHDGKAIHEAELAVLTNAIESRSDRRDALRHISNLQFLRDYRNRLERWAAEPDRFELLGPHHERLREIHEVVQARVRGRK
jgi:hypothetical protein